MAYRAVLGGGGFGGVEEVVDVDNKGIFGGIGLGEYLSLMHVCVQAMAEKVKRKRGALRRRRTKAIARLI